MHSGFVYTDYAATTENVSAPHNKYRKELMLLLRTFLSFRSKAKTFICYLVLVRSASAHTHQHIKIINCCDYKNRLAFGQYCAVCIAQCINSIIADGYSDKPMRGQCKFYYFRIISFFFIFLRITLISTSRHYVFCTHFQRKQTLHGIEKQKNRLRRNGTF